MIVSPFVLCKVRHNVSLAPCYTIEPRVGINQDLTEKIMHYSESLKGVILSFSNVQLERPYGAIVNEMPFIHCKILADALVFQPKVGMKLCGIVNKIGSNHIGMLFAGVFNGSVAKAELPKGYLHNYAQDCWLGEDGSFISVEDKVTVKVLRVHVAGGMIAIEATMRFTDTNVGKPSLLSKGKTNTHVDMTAEDPITKSIEEKKVKKRKEGQMTTFMETEEVVWKKTKVVDGSDGKMTKDKIARFEEANQVNDMKKKKCKLMEDVVTKEEEEVVVKRKKHREQDVKRKKHTKSKKQD